MDKYELYAVGHYLSSWPDNMTFEGILKGLKDEDYGVDITVNETYELYPEEDIACLIEDMEAGLRSVF